MQAFLGPSCQQKQLWGVSKQPLPGCSLQAEILCTRNRSCVQPNECLSVWRPGMGTFLIHDLTLTRFQTLQI
jgi:hypothetical protein